MRVVISSMTVTKPGIRRYRPHTDHAAVVEICNNVYGGTDALPRMISSQASEPNTLIWVAENSTGAVDSLVCSQERGGHTFVWGARTRQEARRQGLAAALLEHVEAHSYNNGTSKWLLSTTIPANGTMVRMFRRLGYEQQCEISIWPSWQVVGEGLELLSQQGQQKQGQQGELGQQDEADFGADGGPDPGRGSGQGKYACTHPLVLSLMPRAAEMVRSAAAEELLARWEACSSPSQLLSLHSQLRHSRLAAHKVAGDAACGSSGAFAWLPQDYKMLPLQPEQLQEFLQAGHIWILPVAASCEEGGQEIDGGVLAVSYCAYHRHWYAGIAAGSEAALASAVLKALEVQPACLRFYIDRCERFGEPAFVAPALVEEQHSLDGWGPRSYLVYHKRLG